MLRGWFPISSYLFMSLLSLLIILDVIVFITFHLITYSHHYVSPKSQRCSQFLLIISFHDSFEDYLPFGMMLIHHINDTYLASTKVCV